MSGIVRDTARSRQYKNDHTYIEVTVSMQAANRCTRPALHYCTVKRSHRPSCKMLSRRSASEYDAKTEERCSTVVVARHTWTTLSMRSISAVCAPRSVMLLTVVLETTPPFGEFSIAD